MPLPKCCYLQHFDSGLCNIGCWKEATRMFGHMLDASISPDVFTLNTFEDAPTKEGKAKEAEVIIELLDENEMELGRNSQ
ncbi:hypothetical protein RHMOL_Rhmol04G0299500 [Rhododendron molle]|uniref:Uncharacterized protein n=1 Tax=Rhododendron molle TaxID=49168 RepID=A0ACC0P6Z6_RHOML|nr:hypothetical protein RHMOL_Rhmol04G0299500 [Rhododendron molle]